MIDYNALAKSDANFILCGWGCDALRNKRKRKREEVGGEKQKPTWPERGTGHEASFDDYMYIHVFSD